MAMFLVSGSCARYGSRLRTGGKHPQLAQCDGNVNISDG